MLVVKVSGNERRYIEVKSAEYSLAREVRVVSTLLHFINHFPYACRIVPKLENINIKFVYYFILNMILIAFFYSFS